VRYFYLLLLAILVSMTQAAATPMLHERSAMHQGLWWNGSRAGEGVELYQFGQEMFLVWYTYRSDRSPVWYTAQGKLDALSGFSGPLQMHRMESGRTVTRDVGTAAITLLAPEHARFAWSFNSSPELAPPASCRSSTTPGCGGARNYRDLVWD
jgi:hypothetical protein